MNWQVISANRTRSRSRSLISPMGWPLTLVPLVEFRSLSRKSPFLRVILACIKEIEESSITIVLPFILPIVIVSSLRTCDTGGKPGNWMLRVGMIELGLVLIP